MIQQEAQLSQRDRAMLRVIEPLKVIQKSFEMVPIAWADRVLVLIKLFDVASG